MRGDDFDDLRFVDLRPTVFEIGSDRRLGKVGLADDGGKRLPFLDQSVLLHACGKPLALRVDFGFQDLGIVGLARVKEFVLDLGVILFDLRKIAAGEQQLLSGENAIEGYLHCVFDAKFLLIGFDFGEACLVVENRSGLAEFASRHDILCDEEPLLAAVDPAAANFIARIANYGIWVESRLPAARLRGPDFGFGLTERGIGLGGETLCVIKREELTLGQFPGAAESRVNRLHKGDVVLVHVLLRRVGGRLLRASEGTGESQGS